MILVVDSIFISSNCPKSLEGLAHEIRKTIHHAFEDKESLERFETGINNYVKEASVRRSSPLSVYQTRFEEGGTIMIRRSDIDDSGYIRLHYFKLEGHIHVSVDGKTIYQQQFLEEGGEDV